MAFLNNANSVPEHQAYRDKSVKWPRVQKYKPLHTYFAFDISSRGPCTSMVNRLNEPHRMKANIGKKAKGV